MPLRSHRTGNCLKYYSKLFSSWSYKSGKYIKVRADVLIENDATNKNRMKLSFKPNFQFFPWKN